jgi:dihydropyrimidinase
MTTLIEGGTVVNASGPFVANVLIDGERIAGLASPDSDTSRTWRESAERVLDATGTYVIPGAVDAHTHMEMPFGGTSRPRARVCAVDWTSGSPRRRTSARSTTAST